ncbi:MAG TPA: TolC family protein [Cytophagaceae bacterium]|nr:TolC family protein [Cytophagaceae bacterium]
MYSQKLYTISEVVIEARNNNPELRTEKYNINIASTNITTAKLRPNPILNNQNLQLLNAKNLYLFNYGNSIENKNLLSGESRQLWFQLTKPLQLGNLRAKKINFAKQTVVSATTLYSDLNRNVSYNVALKWMDVWLLKANLSLFKNAKENIDTLVYINQNRLKNKVITPTELIRTQLLSDQYNLQLKSLTTQYANEVRNLKYMVGIDDSIGINDKISLVSFDFFENRDTLIAIAIETRTDLAYARSNIELSKKNIDVQHAARLPYFETGLMFNPQNSIGYLGSYTTLNIPIFSRNQGEREKSHFLLKQSESFQLARELQIKTEVQNAYNSFITHKNNLVGFQSIVENSTKVLNTVRYSYLKGNTTLIDFLDAQRTYLETQRLYNEAVFNFRKSYIEVLFTTGLIANI